MDLDKYISENIDEILNNYDDYVIDKSTQKNIQPLQSNYKKVKFINHINNKVKYEDDDEYNNDEYNNDEYYNNEYDNEEDEEYKDNEDNILIEKELNEDDYTDDIIGELYQNMYETNINKIDITELFKNIKQDDLNFINNNNDNENIQNINISDNLNEFKNDDGYYYFNLINIFMKYYNKKYDKNEHFFSEIKNLEKDTSNQMELFFDTVIEFKMLKETFKLDNEKCLEMIYKDCESEKILEFFSKWENQIYMFEFNDNKLISPSLLVCLNYIYQNNLIDSDWNIYNLRNI
jgi:hypothetical protein